MLRDYQQLCHDSVLSYWGEEPWHKAEHDVHRSLLVNLPTSAGKTVTAGAIINSVRNRGRCLFLADTDELCAQPVRTFARIFQMYAAIEKADKRAEFAANVVVGSAQTLARENRLKRFPADHFSYVVVDEAHRGSDRNKKITDYFTTAKVMGMTATAFRARLADLSDFYEHIAFEMGVFDLIDAGYISPIKVLTLPVQVDISKVHQKQGDYDAKELDTTIAPYYEEICRLVLKHAPGRQIITYLPLIKSSREFVEIAQGMKINARHVDGDSTDRNQLLQAFERREFQLLSNSSLLTTGWDCPSCDCLLNLAPTRSAGLFRQKVGRIGRILPNVIEGLRDGTPFVLNDKMDRLRAIAASAKPDALILDLLWQTEKYGLQGPSDLIATNQQERDAIQRHLAGMSGAGNLQAVTAEVQEAHEKRLKAALEEAAKRRSTFNDSINLVAAFLHGRKVLNYEPTMKWEADPVTDAQKDWLTKQGFDPDSGRDKGHVAAFMNLMFSRRTAGLCNYRVVQALEKAGVPGAISYKAQTAYEILGGNYPCSFGKKYFGQKLKLVPASFWLWCENSNNEPGRRQGWFKNGYPIEWAFSREVLHGPGGGECQCIGSHKAPNCPVHPRHETADPVCNCGSKFPNVHHATCPKAPFPKASNEASADVDDVAGITF